MNKIPYIVSAITIALAGLFAILNRFWTGFVYFVLALLLALSLFWAGWLIYKYFTDYKQELEERYSLWKANKLNTTQVSAEIISQNEAAYKKQFSKHMRKNKLVKWFEILICFALAVAFLVGMIFI